MVIQKKAVPLHPQIRILGYGVMVTLQILVLPFLVRVRVAQHRKEHHRRDALFLFSNIHIPFRINIQQR